MFFGGGARPDDVFGDSLPNRIAVRNSPKRKRSWIPISLTKRYKSSMFN